LGPHCGMRILHIQSAEASAFLQTFLKLETVTNQRFPMLRLPLGNPEKDAHYMAPISLGKLFLKFFLGAKPTKNQ
ncbi:hypothetical protein, partial [Microbulbifer elongatus]|uniref:hypothetical protein n=1 Tax=Microbulbifer elongatus TaxID=86173 RepID=UPI001CFD45E7